MLGDPLLAATTPAADRARVFALKFFLVTIGASIGGGLGGWIPGLLQGVGGFDRRAAFAGTLVVLAALNIVRVAIFLSIPPYQQANPHRCERSEPGSARSGGSNRVAWMVMLALAAPELGMSVGHNTIRPFLSLFFTDSYRLPSATTGTILAVMALAAGVGSLATPRIAANLGNVRAIVVLRVAAAGMILLWFSGLALPGVLAGMLVYYALMDGTEAIFITEAMQRLPPNRWTVFSGIYAMAWSIASSGGSILSGLLQDRHGGAFGSAFILGVGGYAFSVFWMLGIFARLPDIAGSTPRAASIPSDPSFAAMSEFRER